MRGSKAIWNFSKKSSDMVAGPFPYTVYTVETVEMVYTVDMVYTVNMLYTVDMVFTVDMVYLVDMKQTPVFR